MSKKLLNVLFSTTRQWNPGDEFILMGTINLLKRNLGVEINPIIYNRNPQIRPVHGGKKEKLNNLIKAVTQKSMFPDFLDNSIRKDIDNTYIDLAVFAGSPEWYGKRSEDLYKICLENKIPTIFMGVGLGEDKKIEELYDYEKELLDKALFITTRDTNTEKFLKRYNAEYIPCPAFFSANFNRKVDEVKKIGLMYALNKAAVSNNINENAYIFTMSLYRELMKRYKGTYEFEFVAHYIEEMPIFYKDFPSEIIRYSYDSKDYFDIYNRYDLVIGTRVHGVGISASMGIPGIMIAHDVRANTVKGFLGEILDINMTMEEAMEVVEKKINNVLVDSEKLIKHKIETEEKYRKKILGINI